MSNWNRPAVRFGRALLVFLICSVAPYHASQSHGYIVRAIPADRATLTRAPARLQYWFSEPLEARFSAIRLRNATGDLLAEGGVSENDRSLLTLRVPPTLPDGAYVVELRPAFASDGHVVAESRVFTVGSADAELAGSRARTTVIPLEAVWRGLTILSTLTLFGATSLYGAVLLPAWGNPRHEAGFLPPRVMRRLFAIAALSCVVAFAGNLLALWQQTMAFFQADALAVWQDQLWRFVRIGTRFGDIWNPRMLLWLGALLLLILAWHYGREGKSQPKVMYPSWLAASWLLALILGTHSALSHAAGALFWAWPALLVDWLHFLAISFWVGGLVTLALVLPAALQPLPSPAKREATLAVVRQFSQRLRPILAVVITSGIFSSTVQLSSVEDIRQTPYGLTLLLKGFLVGSLLALGAWQYLAQRPKAAPAWLRHWPWLRTLRLELLLALAILVAAASLSGTPIPTPEAAGVEYEAQSQHQTAGAYEISQSISPGWTGINSFDTVLSFARELAANEDEVASLPKIQLQAMLPARDQRSEWLPMEYIEDGLYVNANDFLQPAGEWWLLLDIQDQSGETTRAASRWQIAEETALSTIRRPTLGHGLALSAVIASLFWLFWPILRRQALLVDWRPTNVLVALGVCLMTVFLLYLGYAALERSSSAYREQQHPTPTVVNSVLPSQASLDRGAALYTAHCLNWQSAGRDFERLRDGVQQLRDEELFAATRFGWQTLPPCSGTLTDEERWDIVNYFRTLARRKPIP